MDQQAFAFNEAKRDIRKVRQATLSVAVKDDFGNAILNFGFKSIAQASRVIVSLIRFLFSKFCCRAKRNDVRY